MCLRPRPKFVNRVWPHAVEASRSTGIPPQFLVAHAALETGWGKSEVRRADGSTSFNLFGIKAGKSWNGQTVDAKTTEYVDGQAQQSVEKFRAYGSYEESFRDYASLLRNNPRYGAVIGSQDGTEFARRMQQGGLCHRSDVCRQTLAHHQWANAPASAHRLTNLLDASTFGAIGRYRSGKGVNHGRDFRYWRVRSSGSPDGYACHAAQHHQCQHARL